MLWLIELDKAVNKMNYEQYYQAKDMRLRDRERCRSKLCTATVFEDQSIMLTSIHSKYHQMFDIGTG